MNDIATQRPSTGAEPRAVAHLRAPIAEAGLEGNEPALSGHRWRAVGASFHRLAVTVKRWRSGDEDPPGSSLAPTAENHQR